MDSYQLTGGDIENLATSRPLVMLHDFTEPPPNAALVVGVAAGARGEGRLLAGLEYAALRPAFWGLPRRDVSDEVEHVLVTTGSATFGDFAPELARTLARAIPDALVTLVLGPHATVEVPPGVEALVAPESLLESLLGTDLVISAAGQTMLEAAATGTPCVALPVVGNQRRQAERLAQSGGVVVSEDIQGASSVAAVLARDPEARRGMSRHAQRAVDGYGALRIAFEITRLLEDGS